MISTMINFNAIYIYIWVIYFLGLSDIFFQTIYIFFHLIIFKIREKLVFREINYVRITWKSDRVVQFESDTHRKQFEFNGSTSKPSDAFYDSCIQILELNIHKS